MDIKLRLTETQCSWLMGLFKSEALRFNNDARVRKGTTREMRTHKRIRALWYEDLAKAIGRQANIK